MNSLFKNQDFLTSSCAIFLTGHQRNDSIFLPHIIFLCFHQLLHTNHYSRHHPFWASQAFSKGVAKKFLNAWRNTCFISTVEQTHTSTDTHRFKVKASDCHVISGLTGHGCVNCGLVLQYNPCIFYKRPLTWVHLPLTITVETKAC